MLSRRIPARSLVMVCRSLSTMLESGISVRKAIRIASRKTDAATNVVLENVGRQVDEGTDLATAFRSHGRYFPALCLDMIDMAEGSGAMPEVLKHLSEHYENNIRLRSDLFKSLAWPVFQLTAAILIIGLLILVLGMVAESTGSDMASSLTFGLSGPTGAILWLCGSFGSIFGVIFGGFLIRRAGDGQRVVDHLLLKIPVVGTCLRAFAIARFSWAYYLTQQAGMPVIKSLQDSLKATGNGAFIDGGTIVCDRVMEGETLTDSLNASGLFPVEYIEMVAVAEESGTVPEALHRLSPQFEEDARRSLSILTRAASVLVWLVTAGFIIFVVFRIALWYIGMISDLTNV